MFHCQHWEAVAAVHAIVQLDTVHPGYLIVTVQHRHAKTDVVVVDDYGALTWEEAVNVVEGALRAAQPGYRHSRLQALQERLWPSEGPATK